MRRATLELQPPGFLQLLAQDIRWGLLTALAHSDRRVRELVDLLGRPPNLVSYHLGRLRAMQLVEERRSGGDRRDVYYRLNLETLRTLYLTAGSELHPALGIPGPEPAAGLRDARPPVRVLFLCTHNSARSQMAEGILRHLSKGMVEVFSAGTEPTGIHPLAVRALAERGIDIRQHHAKHLDEFRGQDFDTIITVCDRARDMCPTFPGDPEQVHWSFADPSLVKGPEPKRYKAFTQTAQELTTRIQFLLLMIDREAQGRR